MSKIGKNSLLYFFRRSSSCCLSFSKSITVSWVNFKSPSNFLFALSRSIRIFFSCSRDPSSCKCHAMLWKPFLSRWRIEKRILESTKYFRNPCSSACSHSGSQCHLQTSQSIPTPGFPHLSIAIATRRGRKRIHGAVPPPPLSSVTPRPHLTATLQLSFRHLEALFPTTQNLSQRSEEPITLLCFRLSPFHPLPYLCAHLAKLYVASPGRLQYSVTWHL